MQKANNYIQSIIHKNNKLAADPACEFFSRALFILFLNARIVGLFLILPSRVFQRELLLKNSDSSPKLVLLIVGNLRRFFVLRLYSRFTKGI